VARRLLSALLACLALAAMVGSAGVAIAGAKSGHRAATGSKHRVHRHRPRHARRHKARRGLATAHVRRATVRSASAGPGLRFGVYPWAAAGAVSQVAPQLADDPLKALAAVKALQGSRSMTVHLYGQYTGVDSTEADALVSDATWWSANGVRVEMVLRYRPAQTTVAAGYVPWVRAVSARLAALPGVAAIQIGNEANNTGSAAAADGAYPGAVDAIALGVPAARQAVVAAGRPDVKIGFNWAAGMSPCKTEPFWSQLRQLGGTAFTSAVGWVGIDVYPGTWSAPSMSTNPTASQIGASITNSLRCLRTKHMVTAGLSSAATITVAETGYPTDATRSEATQAAALRAIIASVQSVQQTYGVTDLRWFSLRDANTASLQLENGYGLLRDDYSPKPAFAAYQQIIATQGS
jgi:hypothetical protein